LKERLAALALEWRKYMNIPETIKIGVQVGDVRDFSAAAGHGDDGLAFTMSNPENTEFELCFDPRIEGRDDFEQIMVHELVHVWSFSQCGEDPRENMEAVTDELARMIIERKAHEQNTR
jgi:hypothetical protein